MDEKRTRQKKPVLKSARDQLFDGIKQMIMDSTYAPGEMLQVDRLAAEFGVSRTPIREALIRLEGYGLVRLVPNKGATVTEITEADIDNIWEMRGLLEPYAARITAASDISADLAPLRREIERIFAGYHDLDAYIESDVALHTLLYRDLVNPVLRESVERVHQLSMRMRYFPEGVDTIKDSVMTEVSSEHLAIIAALESHDPDGSAEAVAAHIRQGRRRTIEWLRTGTRNVAAASLP